VKQPGDEKMASKPVQPIPDGYTTVTPWIIVKGAAKLMDYLKAAFGAEEIACVPNGDGTIGHAEMRIGTAIVMLFDAKDDWPPTPSYIRLFVEDGDAVYQRALKAGGTSITEMTTLAFGDRVGRVSDPAGNIWWIQTRLEDLTPEEMGKRAVDPTYSAAMRYVQDSLTQEMSKRAR
jgi:PhnB protein